MKERKLTILLALLAALALVFAGACSDGSDEAGTTETPSDDSTSGTEQGGSGGGNGGNNNTSGDGSSENNDNENGNGNGNGGSSGDNTSGGGNESETVTNLVAGKTATYTADSLGSCTAGENEDAYALASVAIKFASDDSDSTTLTVTYYHCYTTDHSSDSSKAWTESDAHKLYTYEGTCEAYTDNGTDTVTVTLPEGEDSSTVTVLAFAYGSNGETLTLTGTTKDGESDIFIVKATDDSTDNANNGIDLFGNSSDYSDAVGVLTADSTGGSSFTLNN